MTNYHTHSNYCDGKATLREMVEFAVAHGFTALGFSGHCPLPFENTYSITDYEGYCREVRALKEEYKDRIAIHLGLEMDYVPGMLEDFTPLIEQGHLEYTIGSVHLVTDGPADTDDQLWMIDGSRYQTYDEGLTFICDNRADAEAITPEILNSESRPDGFFAVNDDTAIGILYTAKRMGFNVPQDISICGFTNGQRAVACDPMLTTVEQRGVKVGEEAADILINQVEGTIPRDKPQRRVVRTRLIIRGTTR